MLNRFFGKNFHYTIHLFGISALAIGLPTSKVVLSIGSMLLLLNLLLEANFKDYWSRIKSNKLFLFLAAYWLLHIIGLLWTEDFDYAFHDIRIKVTLIVIPLVLTIKPFKEKSHLFLVLNLFIGAVLITSLINIAFYEHWIGNKFYKDIRELSLFGSHIRYGILIAMGAGISLFFLKTYSHNAKWILLPILLWFTFYTYYSQIISGFIALMIVFLVFLFFIAFQKSKFLGISTLIIGLVFISIPIYLVIPTKNPNVEYNIENLDKLTVQGNPYSHNLNEHSFIDGKPVFIYVSEIELKKEWDKHSALSYEGLDNKKQVLRFTLIRYMTSKGLRKDSVDFQKLNAQDIESIENGIAHFEETKKGLIARFEGIRFQISHSDDPNGHSLLQRLEFWKTGIHIIQKNWPLGVGTGDVQNAFNEQYVLDSSKLLPENRLRAHNTYLTNWISFGIVGFILFILMLLAFIRFHLKQKALLPLIFIFVAISTFLIEDTLETQMGVSFFAFFYGLFINSNPPIKEESNKG